MAGDWAWRYLLAEILNFEIGSAQLIGERTGAGELLLFLHAGVGDRRMWRPQMIALSRNYQTVAYDRRGFGETTTADEVFSHVEDLRAVLDQVGNTLVTLVGCSQGGRIAVDFALAYPQRVSRLVLIAPAISGAPAPDTFPEDILERLKKLDEADEADDLEQVNAIEAALWLDGPTSQEGRVGGKLRELFLDMNGIALRMPELTKETEPAAAYDRLPQLGLPVLVIWGELDFPHVQERCRQLVDMIPAAQGQEITDTAHLPNLEQPDLINTLLWKFLG